MMCNAKKQLSETRSKLQSYPIGSMYGIYGNIYHEYTQMLAYNIHTWILWVLKKQCYVSFVSGANGS